jgi:hypothetical protein
MSFRMSSDPERQKLEMVASRKWTVLRNKQAAPPCLNEIKVKEEQT